MYDQIVRLFNGPPSTYYARSLADGAFLFLSRVELNYGAHLITKTSKPRRREKNREKKGVAAGGGVR